MDKTVEMEMKLTIARRDLKNCWHLSLLLLQ